MRRKKVGEFGRKKKKEREEGGLMNLFLKKTTIDVELKK